jgi:hypothetical protein
VRFGVAADSADDRRLERPSTPAGEAEDLSPSSSETPAAQQDADCLRLGNDGEFCLGAAVARKLYAHQVSASATPAAPSPAFVVPAPRL